jgi:hypothetical protein
MGEPRPLIESDGGDPLAALVRHAAGLRVDYDVEAGLARHERLVARVDAPVGASATAVKPWSAWGLASVIAVAAVAAGLLVGPRGSEDERGGSERVITGDRSEPTAVVADAPRTRVVPEPREPEVARTPAVPSVGSTASGSPTARDAEAPPVAVPAVRARGSARAGVSGSDRASSATRDPAIGDDDRDDRIEREAAQIRTIRTALGRGDAEAVLALCDEGDREHADGVFAAERQGLRVLALVELGRLAAARSLAERYLTANPSGSLAPRIRRALALEER